MDAKSARKLRPSLGLVDATAISVGAIIGAGIYVVTGTFLAGWMWMLGNLF